MGILHRTRAKKSDGSPNKEGKIAKQILSNTPERRYVLLQTRYPFLGGCWKENRGATAIRTQRAVSKNALVRGPQLSPKPVRGSVNGPHMLSLHSSTGLRVGCPLLKPFPYPPTRQTYEGQIGFQFQRIQDPHLPPCAPLPNCLILKYTLISRQRRPNYIWP